jgi:hypothetical protein
MGLFQRTTGYFGANPIARNLPWSWNSASSPILPANITAYQFQKVDGSNRAPAISVGPRKLPLAVRIKNEPFTPKPTLPTWVQIHRFSIAESR